MFRTQRAIYMAYFWKLHICDNIRLYMKLLHRRNVSIVRQHICVFWVFLFNGEVKVCIIFFLRYFYVIVVFTLEGWLVLCNVQSRVR
jgi:hypothetical protein